MRYKKRLQCELEEIIKIGSVNGALTPIEIARTVGKNDTHDPASLYCIYLFQQYLKISYTIA